MRIRLCRLASTVYNSALSSGQRNTPREIKMYSTDGLWALLRYGRMAFMAIAAICSAGCSYASYTTPLATPIERTTQVPYAWSRIGEGGTVSIGDRLFWVRRYISGAREVVAISAPTKLLPFPTGGTWSKTHTYDNEDGHGLPIYTSPQYYRGSIGVILDDEDRLATKWPIVQVRGSKSGRRWALKADGGFFVVPDTLIEQWGVRYGGRQGAAYLFDIIDSANPTITQVTQSLQISSEEFFSGFTVKGVFIRGVEDLGSGVIRYSLRDDRVSK